MVSKLENTNSLLLAAFTIASYIWLYDSRTKIFEFLCQELVEVDFCKGVVVIDSDAEYYRVKEGELLKCKYLSYHPRSFCYLEEEGLVMAPISANSTLYIFLTHYDEEIGQILQDLLNLVKRALEDLELRKRKDELLKCVQENIRHFQYLSDKLRNPLAVIFGVLEIRDEFDLEKAFFMIKEAAEKMKRVVDEFSELETQTRRLYNTIFS